MTDVEDLITFVDADGNPVADAWPSRAREGSTGKRMDPVFGLADYIAQRRSVSPDTALLVAALLYALDRVGDEAVEERPA